MYVCGVGGGLNELNIFKFCRSNHRNSNGVTCEGMLRSNKNFVGANDLNVVLIAERGEGRDSSEASGMFLANSAK